MRKVTNDSVNAFMNDKAFKQGNTKVEVEDGETSLYLFGNKIARKNGNVVEINNCNYETNTTKERLNGVIDEVGGDRIYQSGFCWYWKEGNPFIGGRWHTLN